MEKERQNKTTTKSLTHAEMEVKCFVFVTNCNCRFCHTLTNTRGWVNELWLLKITKFFVSEAAQQRHHREKVELKLFILFWVVKMTITVVTFHFSSRFATVLRVV